MDEQDFKCPHCGRAIELSSALSGQIKEKLQAQFDMDSKKKLAELENVKKNLEEEKKSFEKTIVEKLESEKKEMWIKAQAAAKKKILEEQDLKLKDLEEQNKEKEEKLKKAQEMELSLRKEKREMEDAKKTAELELQRKLDEERKSIEEKTKKQAEEEYRLKVLEKDKQMEILKKTIEDLRRQSEQGSTQIQGEVQENDLKNLLGRQFPSDLIEDVPTGIRGADLVQTVRNNFFQESGIILWESKNTKSWSNDWIKKLKQDQGIAKADVCILISKVLPDGLPDGFGLIDGVWVCDFKSVLSLAQTLRFHLLELNQLKQSLVGRDQKSELLYNYLAGSQFKNRIENVVMAFKSLQCDLETEKRSMQRIWSKREKEIERMMLNTAGFYGDLQGIIGASLPTIASLEIESGEEEQEGMLF